MKKSKCEKAARRIAKRLWPWIKSELQIEDFHADFRLGAEALLRHAQRNVKAWDHGMIPVELLEQWVKGEK